MRRALMGESLGRALGNARRVTSPHACAVVASNLRYLGLAHGEAPPEREPLVHQTFESYGLFLVEFFRGLSLPPDRIAAGWEVTGWEHIERLNRYEPGWILAGAHTGNWEHLGALATILGRRIVAPTGRQFLPGISHAVKQAKRRRAVRSVSPRRGLRGLLRALERGDLVALPVDGGSFQQGGAVHLLGRRVRLADGAARLSLSSGCPILPVFSRRTAFMRQAVTIHEPLCPPSLSGHERSDRVPVSIMMEELARLLGHQLMACQGQWCIFRSILPGAGRIRWEAPARAGTAAQAHMTV